MRLPPPPFERCVGSIDDASPPLWTVVSKRTFSLAADGACLAREEQQPVVQTSVNAMAMTTGGDVPVHLAEVTPDRLACDVIVRATVRRARATQRAKVQLDGPLRRELQLTGDRVGVWNGHRVEFTEPSFWETMPLSWERAYGGVDPRVWTEAHATIEERFRSVHLHPGSYPRNDVGVGFVMRSSLQGGDEIPLPNIERANQLLAAERFACPERTLWHGQPLSAGWGFMQPHWFPRALHFGVMPGPWPDVKRCPLPEERVGMVPKGLLSNRYSAYQRPALERDDALALGPGIAQLSAPGMAVLGLRGDETFVFQGLTDEEHAVVRLPGAPAKVEVRVGARLFEPRSRLFQLLFDWDAGRLEMLWGASLPLSEGPLQSLALEELLTLPVTVS